MDKKQEIIEIFSAGLEGANPEKLVYKNIVLLGDQLKIGEVFIELSKIRHVHVVGFGKASALMARALETILGNRIEKSCVITKYGHGLVLKQVKIVEAGHPLPDKNGVLATDEIFSIVKNAREDDLVICLISGGGSALFTDIPEGSSIEDLMALNTLLLKVGASIEEINCIRKHLSKVKGGLLSKVAYPARVFSLILSDVIGNSPSTIASGPTAPDPTTFKDAVSILNKYGIADKVPVQLYKILQQGLDKKREETLKESDEVFRRTTNLIIGSNKMALERAKERAMALGYTSLVVKDDFSEDVTQVAESILEEAKKVNTIKTCLLFGGEPTVVVTGDGLGGRNQHLALIMSVLLKDYPNITMMSGGTDGTDGPTDAVGAVVDSTTVGHAEALGVDINKHINDFDSYHFFKKEGGWIRTGPTQTNVMDIMITLIN